MKTSYIKIRNIVFYCLGIIEAILAFRFVFKLAGANPNNVIVNFIYSVSGTLIKPFKGIFRTATSQGSEIQSIFEPATLIAMLVYLLVISGIIKLVEIILFNRS